MALRDVNLNIWDAVGNVWIKLKTFVFPPIGTDGGIPIRPVPQRLFRTTFSKVLASTWDSDFWNQIGPTGAGQAFSQSGGNGVITAGTTANAETILRSNISFTGSFRLREHTILSQRIANNNFFVELVDVLGDALAITVNSSTSVTVTFVGSNPFAAANVGQSMYIGALTGFTGVTAVPGRYAIASVAGLTVTFTVAGWATGAGNTGTCSLFGWNYHRLLYDSTTATNMKYDAQRKGWASGDTTAAIQTTVSPGHMAIMGSEDGVAYLLDQLVASGTTTPWGRRASRVVNIADETTPLYLQIRCMNGSTNPASGTTWTIGTISVEDYAATQVAVSSAGAQGNAGSMSVAIDNTPNLGTVATITAITNLNGGQAAHSAASTGNPVRVGGRVSPTTPATQDQSLVAGDTSELGMTTSMQAINKPYSGGETDWQYTAAAAGIVSSTTAVTIKAASGTAGIRNYITAIQISAIGAGTASELVIRDGAAGTVLWRLPIPAAGLNNPISIEFPIPLRGSGNLLLEVALTVSTATPVYVNAQGYTSF